VSVVATVAAWIYFTACVLIFALPVLTAVLPRRKS